ncbi:glycosyltransferase family 4 protein [Vreelandella piezotolerans]|uniref:glycosyltransferase family 4 protein n=1 Tax=Vreelandella piezotolerans TaxID=2609667 RepID=UPI001C6308A8|nr:glycosyltransferase family 4 protein [Halomonas piezotolerans]
MKLTYVLVDPVNHQFSGITRYVEEASLLIKNESCEVLLFKKRKKELVDEFRLRLKRFCRQLSGSGKRVIVEAPETYASTLYLDANANIEVHIRLHFSKAQGAHLENTDIDYKELKLERVAISKAQYISAPSKIAATYAKSFFDFESAYIFPNPLSFNRLSLESKKIYDVGYIGRWQFLKGVHFLEPLIENTSCSFLIQSNYVPSFIKSNPKVRVVSGGALNGVYAQCKIVIVPSIFETSSMVVLEALASGAKVLTWSHIGVCEYLEHPNLIKIEPFNPHKLLKALVDTLSVSAVVNQDFCANINDVNEKYINGIREVFGKEGGIRNIQEELTAEFEIMGKILSERKFDFMTDNRMTPFERKLRKFRRTPILFFKDLVKKKAGLIHVPSANSSLQRKIDKSKPIPGASIRSKKRRSKFLVNAKKDEMIRFHDFGNVNNKLRTCAVFKTDDYKTFKYKDILESVYEISSDFWPLRRENLGRGYIANELFGEFDTSLDWHSRTSHKEFSKLRNVKTVLFFDIFDFAFLSFFRSLHYDLKIVLVSTDESVDLDDSLLDLVDCFVCPPSKLKGIPRKKLEYINDEQLPIWIRKVVQEYLPKEYNYLLPVYNGFFYSEYLQECNRKGDAVVIDVFDFNFKPSNTADDYIFQLSSKIKSMYVNESTYLNYKSLLDDLEVEDLYHFLKYAYKDGVVINVK